MLARFDDGAVAAAERRVGTGRVIAWSTTLDNSWNSFALKPVYLPFVHQIVRYLARYEQPASWRTVGQVVDLSTLLKSRADRVVVTPADERIRIPSSEPGLLELNEQGTYEIRSGESIARLIVSRSISIRRNRFDARTVRNRRGGHRPRQ